eukprot:TRINITY_DN42789_c0_g1_i1.p1 TRINITY_DN42789_c0_g1~~TRINITY_DN42789_c0_g1_i1.p1  ORF type:complete len:1011 (-),score=154.24 TRINITY_DN42789_c0_g1_i1:339-2933(-)
MALLDSKPDFVSTSPSKRCASAKRKNLPLSKRRAVCDVASHGLRQCIDAANGDVEDEEGFCRNNTATEAKPAISRSTYPDRFCVRATARSVSLEAPRYFESNAALWRWAHEQLSDEGLVATARVAPRQPRFFGSATASDPLAEDDGPDMIARRRRNSVAGRGSSRYLSERKKERADVENQGSSSTAVPSSSISSSSSTPLPSRQPSRSRGRTSVRASFGGGRRTGTALSSTSRASRNIDRKQPFVETAGRKAQTLSSATSPLPTRAPLTARAQTRRVSHKVDAQSNQQVKEEQEKEEQTGKERAQKEHMHVQERRIQAQESRAAVRMKEENVVVKKERMEAQCEGDELQENEIEAEHDECDWSDRGSVFASPHTTSSPPESPRGRTGETSWRDDDKVNRRMPHSKSKEKELETAQTSTLSKRNRLTSQPHLSERGRERTGRSKMKAETSESPKGGTRKLMGEQETQDQEERDENDDWRKDHGGIERLEGEVPSSALPIASPASREPCPRWRQQHNSEVAVALGRRAVVNPSTTNRSTRACRAEMTERPGSADATVAPQQRAALPRYIPPHVKRRLDHHTKGDEGQHWGSRRVVGACDTAAEHGKPGPCIQTLAQEWNQRLECPGTCCLCPLQKDEDVELFNCGLRAACRSCAGSTDVSRSVGKGTPSNAGLVGGIKGLPAVCGGRYQIEVELLSDCGVVVGWSAATCAPSSFCDGPAFGYTSSGRKVSGVFDYSAYGPSFGKAGDVIGAMLDWSGRKGRDAIAFGPTVSFMLNGMPLGVAFDLRDREDDTAEYWPPLQLHICQAQGAPFKVLLRGASADAPLRFREDGYRSLATVTQMHFSPFSSAVTKANAWTAAFRSSEQSF